MNIYIKRDSTGATFSTEYTDGRHYSGRTLVELKSKFLADLKERGYTDKQLNTFTYIVD